MTVSDELFDLLHSKGADIVGVADLRSISSDIRNNLPFGISIAVALDSKIISGIENGPNCQYYNEYKRVNNLLDSIGHYAVEFLKERGHEAQQFAATNTGINWETLSTNLPHKTVATRAGLGWIGKCALLITREFGSAVRLTTVLTDAELPIGEPIGISQCGDCFECVGACPGHAISGANWSVGVSRDSIYDAFACIKAAREFEETRKGVRDNICGICIAVCPWTRKYIERLP
jgi:epoxyqueuosine reductase